MGLVCCCRRSSENPNFTTKQEESSDQFNDLRQKASVSSRVESQQGRQYKTADASDNAVIQELRSHAQPSGKEDTFPLVENDSMEKEIASHAGMKDQSHGQTSEDGICLEGSRNLCHGDESPVLPHTGSPIPDTECVFDRRFESIKETWKEQASKLKEELEFLRKKINEERRKFEEDLQKNREQIKQLEDDRNELLNRLSSQAAARMTHDNPNITDLSDQNRPTKISERYSELYDNQWTDAFDNLQKYHHLSETKAIDVLLHVLSVSFDECKEARRLREGLLKALKGYIGEDEDNEDVTILEVMRTLKGSKRNIKKMQEEFNQHVHSKLAMEKNYKEILPHIRTYIDECVEICLLMNIQEPPVELKGLVPLSGSAFDLSAFKTYTKSGNKIEYIVWPAMYLYQNGPLLCKGVAQGMRDSSNVLRPTDTEHDANRNDVTIEVNGQKRDPKKDSVIDLVPNDKNVDNEQKQHKEKRQESLSSADSHREISSHQSQHTTENSITQDGQSDGSPHMEQTKKSTHTTSNHPKETELQEKVENPPTRIHTTVMTVTTRL